MCKRPYEMALLFDFYAEMLTEKQRELFDLYHNEDLSLGEIAEHQGITRQGVRDGIVRAENLLSTMEEKLGLMKKFEEVRSSIDEIVECSDAIDQVNSRGSGNELINKNILRIKEIAQQLRDN